MTSSCDKRGSFDLKMTDLQEESEPCWSLVSFVLSVRCEDVMFRKPRNAVHIIRLGLQLSTQGANIVNTQCLPKTQLTSNAWFLFPKVLTQTVFFFKVVSFDPEYAQLLGFLHHDYTLCLTLSSLSNSPRPSPFLFSLSLSLSLLPSSPHSQSEPNSNITHWYVAARLRGNSFFWRRNFVWILEDQHTQC